MLSLLFVQDMSLILKELFLFIGVLTILIFEQFVNVSLFSIICFSWFLIMISLVFLLLAVEGA